MKVNFNEKMININDIKNDHYVLIISNHMLWSFGIFTYEYPNTINAIYETLLRDSNSEKMNKKFESLKEFVKENYYSEIYVFETLYEVCECIYNIRNENKEE